jgi:hypothetical protein
MENYKLRLWILGIRAPPQPSKRISVEQVVLQAPLVPTLESEEEGKKPGCMLQRSSWVQNGQVGSKKFIVTRMSQLLLHI